MLTLIQNIQFKKVTSDFQHVLSQDAKAYKKAPANTVRNIISQKKNSKESRPC